MKHVCLRTHSWRIEKNQNYDIKWIDTTSFAISTCLHFINMLVRLV